MFKSNDFQANTERLKCISSFYGPEAKALIQILMYANVSVPVAKQRQKNPSQVMPHDASQATGQLRCSPAPTGMSSACSQLYGRDLCKPAPKQPFPPSESNTPEQHAPRRLVGKMLSPRRGAESRTGDPAGLGPARGDLLEQRLRRGKEGLGERQPCFLLGKGAQRAPNADRLRNNGLSSLLFKNRLPAVFIASPALTCSNI